MAFSKRAANPGRFGRQAGVLRPFDLKVKELRSELVARGIVVDNKMLRADLQNRWTRSLEV